MKNAPEFDLSFYAISTHVSSVTGVCRVYAEREFRRFEKFCSVKKTEVAG
jgi:hypothetical protein